MLLPTHMCPCPHVSPDLSGWHPILPALPKIHFDSPSIQYSSGTNSQTYQIIQRWQIWVVLPSPWWLNLIYWGLTTFQALCWVISLNYLVSYPASISEIIINVLEKFNKFVQVKQKAWSPVVGFRALCQVSGVLYWCLLPCSILHRLQSWTKEE